MKIKTDNIEFISFSDGICDIYAEDEEGIRTNKYIGLGFSNRVLGYNRAFAAKAVQVHANVVIRIPQLLGIDIHDIVEIRGLGRYDIELVQNIFETNPPSIDLTLRQLEMFEVRK
ncbi:hypothetical protein N4T77_17085 [Clostridium sp. CX1]|uniref:hypothetical protein n=1 Tax=Clostridium sp. CX1 TaxID=2978346 RepID=UPI0021C093C2|nr:hypothetical protein [Clostridium sp. CX1]MCT8978305.1 hypothetical protein [Clostridium sp. CX1]